jgi:hypothetical protein
MTYRIVRNLNLVLLMSPFLLTSRTDAASASATVVSTTTRGVKLSLSIPRRTYPKDALVTVTVRLQNVSRHTVLVSVNNYPNAIVLDSAHHELYSARDSLSDRALFELHGPGPRPPMKLRTHRGFVISYFVILRGPLLQAVAMIGSRGKEHDIHGPTLPLTLTDEAPPPVTVTGTPTLHATITPPPGVSAPPYFVEHTQCTGNGLVSTGVDGRRRTRISSRLSFLPAALRLTCGSRLPAGSIIRSSILPGVDHEGPHQVPILA